MSYSVKEMFYTLQGEGANSGRAAVFCRFSGCNLWSGLEKDREVAICKFCDTDFRGTDGPGGGRFASAQELAEAAIGKWKGNREVRPFIVCTGGEPLLQFDSALIEQLHSSGFEIAIETNGTVAVPTGIDWVCVSPKGGADLIVTEGDELKLVFPQDEFEPSQFEHLKFQHFFLQPMDGLLKDSNVALALQYCLAHPKWRLSLQTHKILGIS